MNLPTISGEAGIQQHHHFTMVQFKLLLFTHLSAFATGIYVGKSIDADELAAYRSASSDATSAWVKKILFGISFGIASGIILFGGRSVKRLN